jgi:ElaB/YqjD/DUF883 family membrane-anchored ribosome-binding protein
MPVDTLLDPVSEIAAETKLETERAKQTFHESLDKFCDTWIDTVTRGRKAKRELKEDFDSLFKDRPLASAVGGIALGALLGSVVGWAVCRRS